MRDGPAAVHGVHQHLLQRARAGGLQRERRCVRLRTLLALLLVTTGCLGGGDEPLDASSARTRATFTAGTGALQGVVTDVTVAPIAGAAVVLVEINATTTTTDSGGYAFANVRPGTYTLVARAAGFVPASEVVAVSSGRIATVDLLLAPLVSELPYSQAFENVGFFELGHVTAFNLTSLPLPPPLNTSFSIFLTQCQDEECGAHFDLDPPVRTFIYELVWDATTPLAEKMSPFVTIPQTDFVYEDIDVIIFVEGPSPLHARADKGDFDALADRYREACEGGDDTRCGYGFRDEGWPFDSLVRPSGQCGSDIVGSCVVTQQEFTEYVGVFYNAPAPDGFTFLS